MAGAFSYYDYRRLSRKRIVDLAEQVSKSYALLNGDFPSELFALNFELIYDDLIYPQYEILLEEGDDLEMHDGEKVLGSFDPRNNVIALDAILSDPSNPLSAKKAFTFWHELGHAILHGEWMRSNAAYNGKRIVTTESAMSAASHARLEQQANLFASHAAAPEWFLDFVLESSFRLSRPIRYVGPRKYWLDSRRGRQLCFAGSFIELCRCVAYHIKSRFGGLSVEALSCRIRDSYWVVDASDDFAASSSPSPLLRTLPPTLGDVMGTLHSTHSHYRGVAAAVGVL